ncbi:hypothetical protein PAER4900a_00042 [Pseudomonas phage YMC17/07/R4900a]|nr:hypothetical protein PAER4900a_00042 [Pseudomonas phage YMC17/07/R4900a]
MGRKHLTEFRRDDIAKFVIFARTYNKFVVMYLRQGRKHLAMEERRMRRASMAQARRIKEQLEG